MRAARLLAFVCSLLAACDGDSEPPPTVEPEPESPADPEAAPVAPSDPETEPQGDGTVPVVELPEEAVRLSSVRWRTLPLPPLDDEEDYEAEIGRGPPPLEVDFPDQEARAALNRALNAAAFRSLGLQVVEDECRVTLARAEIVSIACSGYTYPDRGVGEQIFETKHFAVRSETLEPIALRDMVAADVDLDARLLSHCRRAARRDELEEERANEACALAAANVSLSPRGLLGTAHLSWDGTEPPIRYTVPYAELSREVLAESPLGRALLSAAGATSSERALQRGVTGAEEVRGLAVSATSRSAIAQYWGLAPAQRASLVLADGRDEGGDLLRVLTLPESAGRERADAVASALGATPRPLTWSSAMVPFLGRTRTPSSVRQRPWGRVQYTVPEGTLLVGASGRDRRYGVGRTSSYGRRDTWLLSWPSAGGEPAWVAGNLVTDHDGCAPSTRAFLGSIPANRRASAERTVLTTLASVDDAERVLFTATTYPESRFSDQQTVHSVVPLGDDCALSPERARVSRPGRLSGLSVVRAGGRSGPRLTVLVTEHHAQKHIVIFTTRDGEQRWSRDVGHSDVVEADARVDGERAVLTVTARDAEGPYVQLAWEGGALVER